MQVDYANRPTWVFLNTCGPINAGFPHILFANQKEVHFQNPPHLPSPEALPNGAWSSGQPPRSIQPAHIQPTFPTKNMAVGQNQWYHFGVGAPLILVYLCSGDWDVHWGYGVFTHGDITNGFLGDSGELSAKRGQCHLLSP